MSKLIRNVRLDLLEEAALRASNNGKMLPVEPADLLLMVDEIRLSRARDAERKAE